MVNKYVTFLITVKKDNLLIIFFFPYRKSLAIWKTNVLQLVLYISPIKL